MSVYFLLVLGRGGIMLCFEVTSVIFISFVWFGLVWRGMKGRRGRGVSL